MIELKSPEEIEKMATAGQFIANTLQYLKRETKVGTNLLEIDNMCKEQIQKAGAKSSYVDYAPDFGSGPFGHWICTSVNDAVLHGIPHDYKLKDGDLLSLDLAVSIDGWTVDSAISFIVGDNKSANDLKLISTTETALEKGIEVAKIGNRISDISYTIGKYLKSEGYKVNTDFGGHGVGRTMHEEPHIPNDDKKGRGYVLASGMTFAIEPWILETTGNYRYSDDGWTLLSANGSRGSHSEHTIAITEKGPRILTLPSH
ncbi:MAG: type I methionyl aminopeptidase [Bifidobacteriaceae bacterium]|jgi:methionyl aminopeptidase|nr:type I methionyl aminopeptidase [Bifidobacteriaceae bacterium]